MISEKLGRCGRQNMLWLYLKVWEWEWIFGRAVKAIYFLGVRSPCSAKQCNPNRFASVRLYVAQHLSSSRIRTNKYK